MKECPYCFSPVGLNDSICPQCGREIERWKTGFYSREPLTTRSQTLVWLGAILVLLLILFGFARSCHWL